MIGDGIVLTVVEIRNGRVQLRIDSKGVLVRRREDIGEVEQDGSDLSSDGSVVVARHRDEAIVIGDDIVVTIVDIRGDKVRLGIDAPVDIPVHRHEVYEAIQRENLRSARLEPPTEPQTDPPTEPPTNPPEDGGSGT
ncbi:carbon storage regulator CsrA [Patescibacteria group bacterium]|nr:carbon storage regulator CsrA [Patescibacteria group bacterium]MBU2259203.1 carbon storage regulator CsrA [Patescibacteria group bacterium]